VLVPRDAPAGPSDGTQEAIEITWSTIGSVHAFDLMAVVRYANDGINSQRTVRLRYDVPPPKDGDEDHFEGDVAAVRLPRGNGVSSRSAARSRAAAR
jgi:hypothetical protein